MSAVRGSVMGSLTALGRSFNNPFTLLTVTGVTDVINDASCREGFCYG